MSVITVRKYLASLIEKGLVNTELSPTHLLNDSSLRSCFTLPNEVFLLKLLPSVSSPLILSLCATKR